MIEIEEYLKLRQRPPGRPVMYQKWRDLSFFHFSIEPEVLRPTIPEELHIDTFPDSQGRERAWVGLIPFWMTDVRLAGLPPIPGVRTFPETNLRTYVHRNGKDPGIWFYSLEAASRLACITARTFFGLPYHEAKMSVEKSGALIDYKSSRTGSGAQCNSKVTVGRELGVCEPGSFEFFLVERYLLFSKLKGRVVSGQVHHHPYPIQGLSLDNLEESLTSATGLGAGNWEHFLYSPGVDVEIFGIKS